MGLLGSVTIIHQPGRPMSIRTDGHEYAKLLCHPAKVPVNMISVGIGVDLHGSLAFCSCFQNPFHIQAFSFPVENLIAQWSAQNCHQRMSRHLDYLIGKSLGIITTVFGERDYDVIEELKSGVVHGQRSIGIGVQFYSL